MSGRRWLAVPGMAGVAMLAAGLIGPLPTAVAQDETTHVDSRLAYLCPFPSGEQRVEVHLVADLPTSATVEQPVRPAGLTIALAVPQAALADLTAIGATSVTAVARVGVTITHGGSTAETNWSGTETSQVQLPADGDLELPLEPARVVPAILGRPGAMVFAAGDTALTLTSYLPDGAVTDPPSLELSCTLAPDQDPVLATVQVSTVDTPVTEEPPPGAVRVDEPPAGAPAPGDPAVQVEIPQDCAMIESPPGPPPTPPKYCAYVVGYSNLNKLNASVAQPMSLVNIGPTSFADNFRDPLYGNCRPDAPPVDGDGRPVNIQCQKANILPNIAGDPVLAPSVNQWVLPFGFVPTKASMQLTQVGLSNADIAAHAVRDPIYGHVRISARYIARVYDASVNGVPFDLGPNCRTAEPIEVRLTGKPGRGAGTYNLTTGGPLNGTADIPAFTGCGVTEDVSPLLTGLISSSGNAVKLTQGSVCTLTGNQTGCPPNQPVPER
ncbi:DUF6801 domain-containing protein [Actinophytocola sediminis]